MKAGKLTEAVLKRSVLKLLSKEGFPVVAGPGVGRDYSALRMPEGQELVLAVCPVTRCRSDIARAGVFEAVNNVACAGAEALGIMASVIFPTKANEQQLRTLMQELDQAAAEAHVAVIGGHTEVSRRVEEPFLTITAAGAADPGKRIDPGGAREGMDIVISKWIGLQGTAILARERKEELSGRFAMPFLDRAEAFGDELLILAEISTLLADGGGNAQHSFGTGRVAALHDLSEGGIFGGLWELGEASGVGLEVDLKKIPIRQETVEICEFFDINPYKLISGGSLLAVVSNGQAAVRAMEAAGVPAAVIGRTTAGNDRVVRNGQECRYLETPQTDELYKVM